MKQQLLDDVTIEPTCNAPGFPVCKGDISYRHSDSTRLIDVTIGTPSAHYHISHASHLRENATSRSLEESKTALYLTPGYDVPVGSMTPFALEAAGRLGVQASKFAKQMFPNERRVDRLDLSVIRTLLLKREMYNQISAELAYANGRMLLLYRQLQSPPSLPTPAPTDGTSRPYTAVRAWASH